MRLQISHNTGKGHLALATAVSWDGAHLVSGSDDQTVQRWTAGGQHSGQVSLMCVHMQRNVPSTTE